MTTALLLIAHGSRNQEANADLHHVVEEMRRRGPYAIVEPAFLELASPTIEEAGRRCVDLGAQRVLMIPYFLSAGVHVREDLHAHRGQLQGRFRGVEFILGEPLGVHPLLIDMVAQRALEAEQTSEPPG